MRDNTYIYILFFEHLRYKMIESINFIIYQVIGQTHTYPDLGIYSLIQFPRRTIKELARMASLITCWIIMAIGFALRSTAVSRDQDSSMRNFRRKVLRIFNRIAAATKTHQDNNNVSSEYKTKERKVKQLFYGFSFCRDRQGRSCIWLCMGYFFCVCFSCFRWFTNFFLYNCRENGRQ